MLVELESHDCKFLDFLPMIRMLVYAEQTGSFELNISLSEQLLLHLAAANYEKYRAAFKRMIKILRILGLDWKII